MFYIKSLVRSMLIFAVLCSFPISCIAAEPSREGVVMRIVELTPRIDETAAAGYLKLLFENNGKDYVSIRFCDTLSFGAVTVLERKGKRVQRPYFYLPPDSFEWYGGCFAAIRYTWESEDGSSVLSGIYELSIPSFVLKPGEKTKISAPISLPPKAGKYKLKVRFDNRCMTDILDSASNTTRNMRLGIVDLTSSADIVLPSQESEDQANTPKQP